MKITTMPNPEQLAKIQTAAGFIAALDQSGGSTPKALRLYGVPENDYDGDAEMFARVHAMRARIVTDAAFSGESILGAILFEDTMDREFGGRPAAEYLWHEKRVVPFLKVDQGLDARADEVQLMKPMPHLESLLEKAAANRIFGTKMRSVIYAANADGIQSVVAQQFATGKIILAHGLIPIIEPEIDIHAADKSAAEEILRAELTAQLNALAADQKVLLKLTLPETTDFYRDFVAHPNCLRVAALSGGYSREEACRRLAENRGMVASFSRALTEGLTAQQSAAEFTEHLRDSIAAIAAAAAT